MPWRAAWLAQSPPPVSPFSFARRSPPANSAAGRDDNRSSRTPNPHRAIDAVVRRRFPPANSRASLPPEISVRPLHPWRVLGKRRLVLGLPSDIHHIHGAVFFQHAFNFLAITYANPLQVIDVHEFLRRSLHARRINPADVIWILVPTIRHHPEK